MRGAQPRSPRARVHGSFLEPFGGAFPMTVVLWCFFVGILLPYACFGIARNRGRSPSGERLRDKRNARDFPNRIDGVEKRAWDAHLNAFESLPGFAAAVIIAHMVNAPPKYIDILAAA